MGPIERGKLLVRRFSEEIRLYRRVIKHPQVPLISRILLGLAIAYAVSPIDLIPDFIPVVGHMDDLLILPGLIWLAIHFIPTHVLEECRQLDREGSNGQTG